MSQRLALTGLLVSSLLWAPACGGDDGAEPRPSLRTPAEIAAGVDDVAESSAGDTFMNRYDAILRDMLGVLQGVTDVASAKAAVPNMESLGQRLSALRAEAEGQGGLGLAQQAVSDPKAWSAAGTSMSQVQPKLSQEFMRLGMDPVLRPHLEALTQAMGDAIGPAKPKAK